MVYKRDYTGGQCVRPVTNRSYLTHSFIRCPFVGRAPDQGRPNVIHRVPPMIDTRYAVV